MTSPVSNTTKRKESYEDFPAWAALLGWALSLTIYGLGAYILLQVGIWIFALHILLCGWVEYRTLKESCRHCFYYGKTCGPGRGRLSGLLFKQGDPQTFVEREIAWRDLVPDFLVFLVPLAGGITALIKHFSWAILILLVVLAVLGFLGNALLRGALACRYCRQKQLGCPAEKLFHNTGQKVQRQPDGH